MAQQLQVFQNPGLVANHPTTPQEQLQNALEKKAAAMAASYTGMLPGPTLAQKAAMNNTAGAVQPTAHHAVATQESMPASPQEFAFGEGSIPNPAVAAIDRSVAPASPAHASAFTRTGLDFGAPSPPVPPAPAGDTWGGMRLPGTPPAPKPGLVTSNAVRVAVPGKPVIAFPAPQAAPQAPPVQAGVSYLNASGIDTRGMSPGQIGNALAAAIGSSSRQSGSGPGSQ